MATVLNFHFAAITIQTEASVVRDDAPGADVSASLPKDFKRSVWHPVASLVLQPGANTLNAADSATYATWKSQHPGMFAGILVG